MADRYFSNESFDFLIQLAKNNNRDWFNENKQAYEDTIRNPALDFIADMSYELAKLSPHFLAVPKKVGGSLMRIHRDVRFGKDKRPYKTNVGIQFRHVLGKDVHAPGFYVHIEPKECFLGVGIWRPDSPALKKIRDGIIENSKGWQAASNDKKFRKHFSPVGESLTNAPRGYAKDHPYLEDLKRKDFIAICPVNESTICSSRFKSQVIDRFKASEPYMKFLCKSLELNY